MAAVRLRLIPKRWWSRAAWAHANRTQQLVENIIGSVFKGAPGLEYRIVPTGAVREVGDHVYVEMGGHFSVHIPTVLKSALTEDTPEHRQEIIQACYAMAKELQIRSDTTAGVH